ncbi:MAG: hypothetical protein ACFB5Z_18770 [Elainellaceae cyanobacterium]
MTFLRSVLLASTAAASVLAAPAFAQAPVSAERITAPSTVSQASTDMGMMSVSGTVRNVDEDFGEIRVDREDTGTLEVIYVSQEDVATLREGDMVDLIIRDGDVVGLSESESGMMMSVNSGPIGEASSVPMGMFVSGTVREIDPDFGQIRVDREDTSGLEVINVGTSEISSLALNPGDDVTLLVVGDDVVGITSGGEMMAVNMEDDEMSDSEMMEDDMMDSEMTEDDMMSDSEMMEDDMTEDDMMSDSEMMETEMESTTTTQTTTTTQPAATTAPSQPVRGLW